MSSIYTVIYVIIYQERRKIENWSVYIENVKF